MFQSSYFSLLTYFKSSFDFSDLLSTLVLIKTSFENFFDCNFDCDVDCDENYVVVLVLELKFSFNYSKH